MADKQKVIVDEYGVETKVSNVKQAVAEAPAKPVYITKQKQPVEEKKVEEAKAEPDEDDDDPYGEGIVVAELKKDERDEIGEKIKQQAAQGSRKIDGALKDTLVIFKEQEFFLYDYAATSGWQLGDLVVRELDDAEELEAAGSIKDVTEEQVQREENHKRLSKEGYFLPNLKSGLFSQEFIKSVDEGLIWIPKTNEINFQAALLPPGMKELKKMVVEKLQQVAEMFEGEEGKKRLVLGQLLEKSNATRPWLLGMLCALHPTCKIFREPSLPENCAIVDVHEITNQFHAIFTGGFSLGQAQADAVGFGVFVGEQNAVKTYTCQFLKDLGSMIKPRYMHQSVVLHTSVKDFSLLTIGGKSGSTDWTNTCESLDLAPFFKEGAKEEKQGVGAVKATAKWKEIAPMNHARANFAAISIGGAAYVFGGISGADGHSPVLATDVIECYTARDNKWKVYDIPQVSPLAAFSWARHDEGSIFVLGGTDGNLLSQDLILINFKEQTSLRTPANFPQCTGMGTLVFRKKQQMLEHIGGLNSDGINYKVKLGQKDQIWSENKRQHSIVANESGLELTNNSGIYFA